MTVIFSVVGHQRCEMSPDSSIKCFVKQFFF